MSGALPNPAGVAAYRAAQARTDAEIARARLRSDARTICDAIGFKALVDEIAGLPGYVASHRPAAAKDGGVVG